jgi:hypothetical protein
MLYTLPNPTGYQSFLAALQQRAYNRLCSVWGVHDTNYNSFGMVQRNPTSVKGEYIPEYYDPTTQQNLTGDGTNSSGGMFYEDTMAVVSYFAAADPVKADKGVNTLKCRWMFFIDLSKITPGGLTPTQQGGQRLDEVAINDVKNYVEYNGNGFTVVGDHRNIDKVLEWYSGSAKKQALIDNMENKLCFCLELELRYNPLLNRTKTAIPILMPQLIPQSLTLFITATPIGRPKIKVAQNVYIESEYAPTDILTPTVLNASNGWLAGREVVYPFFYNSEVLMTPNYNNVNGQWDRTANALPGSTGFVDGDTVIIQVLNNQF